MNKVITSFLTVLAFHQAVSQAPTNTFFWRDCGDPATRYATTDHLTIVPDPLRFGSDVNYTAAFTGILWK